MTLATPDTRWFQDRLAERDLSQRQLAKLMGLDPAAISLALRGRRKVTVAEAAQLAVLLDVSTSDVMEHFGIKPPATSRVKLIGFVAAGGKVVFAAKGTHQLVDAPDQVTPETAAVQFRSTGTDLERMDGQVWYFDHLKGNPINHVNSWCLVAIKAGDAMLAQVRRGYLRGTYNLVTVGGRMLENQEVAWASPLTWCRF